MRRNTYLAIVIIAWQRSHHLRMILDSEVKAVRFPCWAKLDVKGLAEVGSKTIYKLDVN
jgi:hypothetical protein